MGEIKLKPCDILIEINKSDNPLSVFKRWLIGPYSHAFLYLGRVGLMSAIKPYIPSVPMLFESYGRGCALRSLSERYGQEVVVMRYKREEDYMGIERVLNEAIKLASNPKSYYDYYCVVRHVLPRVILEKLGLPVSLSWQRDQRQICSEAVLEVFLRAKIPILPENIVPMPGDFVTDSDLLTEVGRGKLSEEWLAD